MPNLLATRLGGVGEGRELALQRYRSGQKKVDLGPALLVAEDFSNRERLPSGVQ